MKDTTEMLQALGQQVVELMKQLLEPEAQAESGLGLAHIETALREVLRRVGAESLRQFLESMQRTPEAECICECGHTLQYQREREATILTVFGRVTYRRAYYAAGGCGHGCAPLDDQYGLKPGQVSAGLAEMLTLAGVELAFDHSRRWLKGFLLFELSENTIRHETQTVGEQRIQEEAEWQDHSQDLTWLQTRLRTPEALPSRLYSSLDAAKVRIASRHATDQEAEGEAWRDLKVGCWYEVEPVPTSQHSSRQRAIRERGQQPQRAKNLHYYCDITEAASFGELMWATGCHQQAERVPELIFVCDGATWIWNLVTTHYPQAVQIVDWYHAADRLTRVAQVAFTQNAVREQWQERVTTDLWEGRVHLVIQACEQLAPQCAEARAAVTYFTHNATRMNYADYRDKGYVIGSGTIESGCKQIVAQRLKCSGAQWQVAGAVRTAKARAAWLSGEWTPVCTRWAELPLAL